MVTMAPSIVSQIQQLRDRRDLVRFVGNIFLAEDQTLVRAERRNHVDRSFCLSYRLAAA